MSKIPLVALAVLAVAACKHETPSAAPPPSDGRLEIRVSVDAVGYHPAEAHAPGGKPVRLTLTRTTDEGCGQEIVVPSLKLKRELPLNQPVSIDLDMPASGKLAFTCGMDMMRGSLIAD